MNLPLNTVLLSFIIVLVLYAIIFWHRLAKSPKKQYVLVRYQENPVISPLPHRDWESQGTFNPAAVMDDEGKVHLLYRAIGRDGLSRIGYASSRSGRRFDDRSTYPVYEPSPGFGMPEPTPGAPMPYYDIEIHPSGGGWGGAEDPRAVRIDDTVYMTYTAFEGWNDMRIALTSISLEDLKKKRWRWKRPILISPPRTRSKNWVIFPGKIGGKYAILHGIAPKISIAYVDSLSVVPPIRSSPDHGGRGYHDPTRDKYWDAWVRGAGAPPVKTKKGWLLIYHAIDQKEPSKYKVGAMLLDLKDPTKVLYRAPAPILSPDMPYENDGKPGIVYASGSIIKDGKLIVYYGGGDKHVCAAETPLDPLLDWLVKYGKVR
jgi:predicted GH43/DUF377 family glycosyl hydrolase